MALQSSGQIDISDIQAELGSSSGSLRTLSAAAGFSTPDAMSEFYGYSSAPDARANFATIIWRGDGNTQTIKGAKFGSSAPFFNGVAGSGSSPLIYSTATGVKNFFYAKTTMSLSVWFKCNDKSTGNSYTIFSDYNGSSFNAFIYLNTSGQLNIHSRYNNSDLLYTRTGDIRDDNWHHLVVTLNQSTATRKTYLDNSLINTGTIPSAAYDAYQGTSIIGASVGCLMTSTNAGSNYHNFVGLIDRVRVWSQEISSSDVTTLYNESATSTTNNPISATIQVNLMFDNQSTLDSGTGITWTQENIEWSSRMDFQPDLVWIKCRNQAGWHRIADAVRGANKQLASNSANNETSVTNELTSFNSNGFTLSNSSDVNGAENYVAWAWKAGNGTSTNTNGTVTSTVSANQAAGFSISTFTAPATNNIGFTIGHGLSQAPEMFIIKDRDLTGVGWHVYSSYLPSSASAYLQLNSTNAYTTALLWNSANPSSSIINLRSGWSMGAGNKCVLYSFHSVTGYQKVGSYTGNAGTNAITTGFAPRFVMIKAVTTTGAWFLHDMSRLGTHGYSDKYIQANSNTTEIDSSDNDLLEFTSTGFTLRTNFGDYNGSGQTYIYLAIA